MTMIAILAALAGAACVQVPGERILARDLAAAAPAFAALPPDQPLGYAPAPGARRVLGQRDLARFGIAVEGTPEICVERLARPVERGRLLAALRAALARDVRLELVEFSRYPLPEGELDFPASALPAHGPQAASPGPVLWRGRLRTSGGRSFPVWARVRLSVTGTRVIAVENLVAGRPIQASQVRLERADLFPFGDRPAAAIEQVAGKLPRRSIRANAAVFPSALAAPSQVERGDDVQVEVASGAARLRFRARAESAGNAGDVIAVRNPANNREFRARVEGSHKVIADAEENFERTGSRGAAAGAVRRR